MSRPVKDRLRTKFLPPNVSVTTDLYWLKMCISNLVENAIRYGKPPIEIKILEFVSEVQISIIDHGAISFSNLKQIMGTKHKNTKGLGLGLSIVDKTLTALGGSLEFSKDPTSFIIKLEKNNEPHSPD